MMYTTPAHIWEHGNYSDPSEEMPPVYEDSNSRWRDTNTRRYVSQIEAEERLEEWEDRLSREEIADAKENLNDWLYQQERRKMIDKIGSAAWRMSWDELKEAYK